MSIDTAPIRRNCTRRRALSVAGATLAPVVVWTLAGPLGGVEIAARQGGAVREVGPGAVAVSALLVSLAAWGLLVVLERVTGAATRIWTVVAAAVLVLSLAGPLGQGEGTGSVVALAGMHLAVGAVLLPNLRRTC